MGSRYERPLDPHAYRACQKALSSALAAVQQWRSANGTFDPKLKAKLALLIIRQAARGETNPVILRKRALATYFLESACDQG